MDCTIRLPTVRLSANLHRAAVNGIGTTDYEQLTNRPKINGVEVVGDKTSEDYGIYANAAETAEEMSRTELYAMFAAAYKE